MCQTGERTDKLYTSLVSSKRGEIKDCHGGSVHVDEITIDCDAMTVRAKLADVQSSCLQINRYDDLCSIWVPGEGVHLPERRESAPQVTLELDSTTVVIGSLLAVGRDWVAVGNVRSSIQYYYVLIPLCQVRSGLPAPIDLMSRFPGPQSSTPGFVFTTAGEIVEGNVGVDGGNLFVEVTGASRGVCIASFAGFGVPMEDVRDGDGSDRATRELFIRTDTRDFNVTAVVIESNDTHVLLSCVEEWDSTHLEVAYAVLVDKNFITAGLPGQVPVVS